MTEPPIDMVFTYVDGAHSDHVARREAARKALVARGEAVPVERARWYDSLGELTYGLRSALQSMPWLRRIHIVTDGQIPPVDPPLITSGRVRIIDHATIIPAEYRPVLASTIIESFLHRIPGLSDLYLYNNDDFMHGRSIAPEEFRTTEPDGQTRLILRTAPALIRVLHRVAADHSPPFLPAANAYTAGIANSARLCRMLGTAWRNTVFPRHVTQIYRIATARQMEQLWAEELHRARQRHFRSTAQLSWSTLAYSAECHWHGAQQMRWMPFSCRQGADELFLDFARPRLPAQRGALWRKVAQCRAAFICLNNIPPDAAADYHFAMRQRGLDHPVTD